MAERSRPWFKPSCTAEFIELGRSVRLYGRALTVVQPESWRRSRSAVVVGLQCLGVMDGSLTRVAASHRYWHWSACLHRRFANSIHSFANYLRSYINNIMHSQTNSAKLQSSYMIGIGPTACQLNPNFRIQPYFLPLPHPPIKDAVVCRKSNPL
jgi:hypothetical protein